MVAVPRIPHVWRSAGFVWDSMPIDDLRECRSVAAVDLRNLTWANVQRDAARLEKRALEQHARLQAVDRPC